MQLWKGHYHVFGLNFKAAVALGVIATAGGAMLISAACSSNKSANATPSTTATQAASAASDAPAVISALNILDNAGLHDFDQSISAGTIPPTALNVVEELVATMKLTPWPSDLKTPATNMTNLLVTYMNQLNATTPDLKALAPTAHNAHEGFHQFAADGWDWLYKQAGMNVSAPPDSDAGGATASPSAAATP